MTKSPLLSGFGILVPSDTACLSERPDNCLVNVTFSPHTENQIFLMLPESFDNHPGLERVRDVQEMDLNRRFFFTKDHVLVEVGCLSMYLKSACGIDLFDVLSFSRIFLTAVSRNVKCAY